MTWLPATPAEVMDLFARFPGPWWIAGGRAIEHAVGRPFRAHGDLDVLVLRRDHLALHETLAGWECWATDAPGTLRPWSPGERLAAGVHDVWCRPGPGGPWRLQVMVDESDGTDWVSRRDARVRRPIESLGDGHFLAPEVELFYKAKEPRDKDEVDRAAVWPLLTEAQRNWLSAATETAYGVRSMR